MKGWSRAEVILIVSMALGCWICGGISGHLWTKHKLGEAVTAPSPTYQLRTAEHTAYCQKARERFRVALDAAYPQSVVDVMPDSDHALMCLPIWSRGLARQRWGELRTVAAIAKAIPDAPRLRAVEPDVKRLMTFLFMNWPEKPDFTVITTSYLDMYSEEVKEVERQREAPPDPDLPP